MATRQAQLSKWQNELVPNIVDHLARVTPTAPYALYPNSPWTYDDGYRTVTYKDFANAINGLAWWLQETLGPAKDFEVLAYIGPNDVRYTVLVLAAVKAGYLAFLTSPRNSIPAHIGLFDKLNCRTLLSSNPNPPAVDSILEAHQMRHFQLPSVEDLLDKAYPHYPYDKTFETAQSEPLFIVHTSGSTGIPKPLVWTHETGARNMNFSARDPPAGVLSLDRLHQGKRLINMFPPYHAACLVEHFFDTIPFGTVMIAPLSGAIPTAEGVVEALKKSQGEVAFLVPSIISELSQEEALLDYCSEHLELILYAGGDLPQVIGDKVASKVPVRSQYGASEIGITPQLLPANMPVSDWRYVQFHPSLGFQFEEVTEGVYEMVVKRDASREDTQPTFTIGPHLRNLQEYRSRDLFERHPSIPDFWCWRARVDDIIVFLNGEKTNPVSMELYVAAHADGVAAALVAGMQRFQAALLIEPAAALGKLDTGEEAVFIEKIWPIVEEANRDAPAHARIEKSMVLLTSPDKPMLRAGKGTIQRQATIMQYTEELDALYKKADELNGESTETSVDIHDTEQVSRFIKNALSAISPELEHEDADNFFAIGMDSLQAMRLIRALRKGLLQPDLALSTIYHNPSVSKLAEYIVRGRSKDGGTNKQSEQAAFEKMLAEYEQRIHRIPLELGGPSTAKTGEVAILTGSTGSLGTHLLRVLLTDPSISHVYCFNRRKDAQAVQQTKAMAIDSSLEHHTDRVTFLHAFLDQPNFGLDEATYEKVRSDTTLIIHNAWPVNFNLSLPAFRPQLDGLVNLFRLSAESSNLPKLLFISSISSVQSLYRAPQRIPEAVVRSFDAPFDMGYAKSKLLSEILCDYAADSYLHIPVSFARIGQIAGPIETPGLWNPTEWLPSLIISSMNIGALPDDLGASLNRVDWMPVDMLAKAIVQLVTAKEDGSNDSAGAFNVVNPRPTTWAEVLPSFVSTLEKYLKRRVDIIPSSEWLSKVHQNTEDEQSARTEDSMQAMVRANPASKLLEFYKERMADREGPGGWKMDHATGKSETLRDMPRVNAEWIDKWIEGWVTERARVVG